MRSHRLGARVLLAGVGCLYEAKRKAKPRGLGLGNVRSTDPLFLLPPRLPAIGILGTREYVVYSAIRGCAQVDAACPYLPSTRVPAATATATTAES